MHVVGARFRTLAGAQMALRAIRAGVPVAPGEAAVRPLGSTRYEEPARHFLLAGRFQAGDVERVLEIIHAHDGSLVERRVELPVAGAPGASPRRESRRLVVRARRRRPAAPSRVRAARVHRPLERRPRLST